MREANLTSYLTPQEVRGFKLNNKDWETTGRIASLLGAIKIEHHGTQNHQFSMAEFQALFEQNFGV